MEAISMEAVGEVNRPAQLSVQTVVLDTTKSRDKTGRWSRDDGKFIFTNLPERLNRSIGVSRISGIRIVNIKKPCKEHKILML